MFRYDANISHIIYGRYITPEKISSFNILKNIKIFRKINKFISIKDINGIWNEKNSHDQIVFKTSCT